LDGTTAHVALSAAVTGGEQVRFRIDGIGTQTVPVTDAAAHAQISIPEVRRWHGRRDPYLYSATAELLVSGSVTDSVDVRFGCRELAVHPEDGFLLNGEPYPLRGVSRHQDWEGVGNAITADMMAADLDLLIELGATTVRLATTSTTNTSTISATRPGSSSGPRSRRSPSSSRTGRTTHG